VTTPASPLPDVTRRDVGTTLISEWRVDTPQQQHIAAEALLSEWADLSARVRPTAFVQLSCFISTDGRVLLSYAQWRSDEAHISFARRHRPNMVNRIDQAVPGIQRPGLVRYRLHRSVSLNQASPAADSIIVRQATTDQADQAEPWANASADALREKPPRGVAAAHFLLSTDHTRAMLYAPALADERDAVWPILDTRGVRLGPLQRYQLIGSVVGPGGTQTVQAPPTTV